MGIISLTVSEPLTFKIFTNIILPINICVSCSFKNIYALNDIESLSQGFLFHFLYLLNLSIQSGIFKLAYLKILESNNTVFYSSLSHFENEQQY